MGDVQSRHEQFDQIVVAYGFKADNRFIKNWELNLTELTLPLIQL